MKTTTWFVSSASLMACLVLALTSAPTRAQPPLPGQNLKRVGSNFTAFDGNQIDVNMDASEGGVQIYDQTVKTQAGVNALYVTLQATTFLWSAGSGNSANVGLAVNCVVDGAACNTGFGADQDNDYLPSGWIEVAGNSFSEDTATWMPVSYTWCTPIAKTKNNLHIVQLFAGVDEDEGPAGAEQLVQTVSVNVDSNRFNSANTKLGNACASYPTPNPTSKQ